MFLAVRDLRRTHRRFLLVGLVVALVAVLSTVLTGLADGLVRDGTSGLRALPVTHLAFAPHAESVFSRSTLDGDAAAAWAAAPGVEATPIGVSFVNAARVGGGPSIELALFGVAGDGCLAERTAAPAPLPALDGLVLAEELRDEGVAVGDRYRVGGSDTALYHKAKSLGAKTSWCPDAIVYETVPPERMALGYQYRRARDQAATSFWRKGASERRSVPVNIATAGGKVIAGSFLVLVSPLMLGRTLVDGVRLVGYGLGYGYAMAGRRSRHYEVQQGS